MGGAIPPELGWLAKLEELLLWVNRLQGAIPSELGNLANLRVMHMLDNQLDGELPAELGRLTKLYALLLSGNSFTGCIPGNLANVFLNDLGDLGLAFCGATESLSPSRAETPTPTPTLQSSSPPTATPAPTPVSDKAALVALYQATDGPNWLNNTNWLSEAPIGTWHGVSTDASGRVTELSLPGNLLSGAIPAALGRLSNLQVLVLEANELSGVIPPELGNLANLKVLNFGFNQVNGEIPPELGRLAKLEDLMLYYNRLQGAIPPELGNLANLRVMHFLDNQLGGELPSELGRLTSLQLLLLSGNRFTGCIPGNLDAPINDLDDLRLALCGKPARRVIAVRRATLAPTPDMATTPAPADDSDRDVLVALYESTDGPNWMIDTNWLSETPLRELAWRLHGRQGAGHGTVAPRQPVKWGHPSRTGPPLQPASARAGGERPQRGDPARAGKPRQTGATPAL